MSRRALSDNREVDPREVGWMRRAVALAAESRPHPNPRVGATVLTPDGEEIGAAWHVTPGTPHAEVLALAQAGAAARGATVVTTLEPCSHEGRMPPCTDALIAAGVATVIVGAIDPDHQVAGSGIEKLRAAGIEVRTGVAEAEVVAMDPGYFHHRSTGLPRFRVKLAATLDGQIAAADGTSQWITSPQAREDAHRLRARADAVLIGAGTLRADDPALDVRLSSFEGSQPIPVILAGQRPLPAIRRIYDRSPLIYAPSGQALPGDHDVVPAPGADGVDLPTVAKDLASRGILEVLVDGGPRVATSFVAAGLADELTIYLGAKLAGGSGVAMFSSVFTTLSAALDVTIRDVTKVGPDLRIDAEILTESA